MNETVLIETETPTEYSIKSLTENDLPDSDGIPMETQRHKLQMDMLIDSLRSWSKKREDVYVGGNMFMYYNVNRLLHYDFVGPDFFAVTGTSNKERKSWVIWQEKEPNVVIELLSQSTINHDKKHKKQIYQDKVKANEYFWYNPFNPTDFAGFVLNNQVYQALEEDEQGRLISNSLNLALVRWKGVYEGVNATWLRWAKITGELLPTKSDLVQQEEQKVQQEKQKVQQEKQKAQQEKQRADYAEQRLKKLLAQMQALGIEADSE